MSKRLYYFINKDFVLFGKIYFNTFTIAVEGKETKNLLSNHLTNLGMLMIF